MNTLNLRCPYCHSSLAIHEETLERKQVSVRCKSCYGIFTFMPSENRVSFKRNRNYYEIFGLDRASNAELIKRRYRDLALKFHPDRQKNKDFANEKMKHINYIYSVLGEASLRKEYDAALGFEEEFEGIYSTYEPPYYIYQDSIETVDAFGLNVLIKRGDYIYFPADQYLSIFGKRIKLKGKDYLGVKVQKIFNPKYKNDYEKLLRKKLDREPLLCVNFGNEELIIFKEDFQRIWIGQKTLDRKDIKKVIIYGLIIILLLIAGIAYLYSTYKLSVTDDGKEEVIRNVRLTK